MLSSGSAIGHGNPEHRLEALLRLSVFSIGMCLLFLALLIISMRAASSILNELDFYQKWLCSARLEGLDDPCLDSLLDCVVGKSSSVMTALGVPVASLKCCGWPGCRVIPLASNTRGLVQICSWLLSGGTGSRVLPAAWLGGASVPLQPLCTVTVWKVPHLSMDLFSPLECTHNIQTKLCFTFFSFKVLKEFKEYFIYPDSSCGCLRKFDKGLYPDVSPAPLLWSGCLFLLHPFNDTRCNQEAAETQLHNWLSGFLFGSVTLHAVCMLTFRNLGIFC